MRALSLALMLILGTFNGVADDGAASIAVGGLVLMKREPRIAMAKEVLRIGPHKVIVDYEFRNDSNENITTEVAFPIPEYVDDPDGPASKLAGFDDFKLTVDGRTTPFATEVRAFTKRGEVTRLLATMGLDAASFGHEHYNQRQEIVNDLRRLSHAQRQKLVAAQAIDSVADLSPNWAVRKKYHWTQTFPAHGLVHIRHEYTPVSGNSNTIGDPNVYSGNKAVPEYAESCPGPDLRRTLSQYWNGHVKQMDTAPLWISDVDFILTTANTWKTPIEDFTLIVERAKIPADQYRQAETSWVSFCWNGPIKKIDDDHFEAHAINFVPKKELSVGYIFRDRLKSSGAR